MANEPERRSWKLTEAGAGFPASTDVADRREAMRALDALQIVDGQATVRDVRVGGISCVEASPAAARGTLLYFHGGGFRMGEPRTWAGLASRLAVAGQVRVIIPDYRLAPEHPFPAALDDALAVHAGIAADGPLLVGGDSAGGGIACSLIAALAETGAPAPAGALLLSPWLDYTHGDDAFDRCAASDPAFSRAAAVAAAEQYLQGQDATQPVLSTLRSDLSTFPPSFIAASATEVLVDQSIELARGLARAGRPVELRIEPGLLHVWPIMQPAAPETEALVQAAGTFIRRRAGN